jgi:hypothetical protein
MSRETALERDPAREDHVHQHQRFVLGRVNVDVVRGVVRAVVSEFQALPANPQGVPVVEGDVWGRAVRVVVTQQQAAGFGVTDADYVVARDR